ncbi:MAG: polyketide synthase, partial [Actinomycetota bacterium]|nr:polyketide synthase [Actinomycetota bacterium]
MNSTRSRAQSADSIAVVGVSCRLPGAGGPDAFWRLLRAGEHSITEVPADRWNAEVAPNARYAALLTDVAGFDPGFFGISPREAAAADPQQRLALELAWEALENAGILPAELRDSRGGVFFGAISDDYAAVVRGNNGDAIDRYSMAGVQRGMIANRVSYFLGLRGPSFTVDSAQSSSLVAVHLACESLRRGEAEIAVAGGVSLALTAESAMTADRFGGLSPDGRCYTFDARANGYVRGEGGAAVVLKPLERALADGDPVLCVVRGGAVNNDGGGGGLTVPHQVAQEEVLRLAYRDARVNPDEVQYVELHGTGTRVGDPIEAAALGAVFGTGSRRDTLPVGSAKTNVGHTEGAAGIVGLVKTVLAIRHRELPPSLNHETPNPDIPLAELRLRVQTERGPWPHPDRPLVAGVSAFGMGGTNCHLVLAEAPAADESVDRAGNGPRFPERGGQEERIVPLPWVLSARDGAALRDQARALRTHLADRPGDRAVDIGHT